MASEQTWDFAVSDMAPSPEAGTFGGECFRAFCHNMGATWHHTRADRYYCARCAADLNLESWHKGEPPVCAQKG